MLEIFAQEPEGVLLAWEFGIGADLFELRGLEGVLVLEGPGAAGTHRLESHLPPQKGQR